MAEALSITPAVLGSAPVLSRLHSLAFPKAEAWGEETLSGFLIQSHVAGFIAEDGAQPAGFILTRRIADEAEVLTVCVAPSFRRRGAGARLLAAAEADVALKGALRLILDVSDANAGARHLYDKAGYSLIGRRARYYKTGADALVLAKTLSRA